MPECDILTVTAFTWRDSHKIRVDTFKLREIPSIIEGGDTDANTGTRAD